MDFLALSDYRAAVAALYLRSGDLADVRAGKENRVATRLRAGETAYR